MSVFVLLIYSCRKNNNLEESKIFTINLKQSDVVTDFFDKYTIIPLETTEENLIGNIDKIFITDKYMYILDKLQAAIFIFSKSGEYINKLTHQGRALGEYVSITDFEVCHSYIYCLSRVNKKIFVYDMNTSFVRDYHLNDWYNSFFVINDSLIYLFSDECNEQYFNYSLYNSKTQQIIKQFSSFEKNQNYVFDYSPFHFTNNQVFVTEYYDESLYLLENEEKQIFCLFDFKSLKKVLFDKRKMSREELSNKMRNLEALRHIKGVNLADSILTLGYSAYCNDAGIRDFVTRINLNTKQNKTIRLNDEVFLEFPFLFNILGFQNGQCITYIPAALAIDLDKRYDLGLCKKYKIKELDNPLIVIHRFKS